MPLVPGTTFVYEGKTEKGNEHKYYAKDISFIMTQYVEGGYEMKLIEIRRE